MLEHNIDNQKFDDIIFENRNKEYGAFSIRRRYNSHLKNSFILIFTFVGLLFGALHLHNLNKPIEVNLGKDERVIVLPDPDEIMKIIEIEKTQITRAGSNKTQTTPRSQASATKKVVSNVQTASVTNVVSEIIEDFIEDIDFDVSDLGVDDAFEGIGDNFNTGPESFGPVSYGNGEVFTDYGTLDKTPIFNGGREAMVRFINKNLNINKLKRHGISGTAFVSFIVEPDGSLSDIKISENNDNILMNECLKVVKKMPKWLPGIQAGNPVRVRMKIPISVL